jgi:hypothetical protein
VNHGENETGSEEIEGELRCRAGQAGAGKSRRRSTSPVHDLFTFIFVVVDCILARTNLAVMNVAQGLDRSPQP